MTKTVLISGGTNGIGKGAAITLLKEGFRVIAFSRDQNKCDTLQKELSEQFSQDNFEVLQGDVTKEEDCKRVVAKALEKFEKIDILINNAGFGYFADCDTADFNVVKDMINTNIFGLALLTKEVVPHFKQNKKGQIINIASISGKRAFPKGEFYSSTKFAVMGYSEGLRRELQPFGIKVATICPGMIKTDFFSKEELERRKERNSGKYPVMLEVKDINRIISFICGQSEHCDIEDITVMPFS